MRVDKPNDILDSDKELERAILDDQMEAYKAEIELKLADFSSHREHLLSLLRDAHDRGTKAEPFDKDKSWLRIETTAYQYLAREKVKQNITSSPDHEARYRAIADAMQRARSMIAEVRQYDLAGYLIREWLQGTKQLADATEQYRDLLYFELELEKITESLTKLEGAANQVADEAQRGRGRPKGNSVLPWNYIYALAGDYRNSTGRKPGAGSGPFSRFVWEFLIALGRPNVEYVSVVDAIKDTRSWARMHPEPGPSPFDEEP